jgi:hypothetical protein
LKMFGHSISPSMCSAARPKSILISARQVLTWQ